MGNLSLISDKMGGQSPKIGMYSKPVYIYPPDSQESDGGANT